MLPPSKAKASRGSSSWNPRAVEAILGKVACGKPVRRNLPDWGRIHIDRRLPFVCVYRHPSKSLDMVTQQLLVGVASYCLASGKRNARPWLSQLIHGIAGSMIDRFNGFLIVEIWNQSPQGLEDDRLPPPPGFTIDYSPDIDDMATLDTLRRRLSDVREGKRKAEVVLRPTRRVAPPGLSPILKSSELRGLGGHLIGIGVRPIYADRETGEPYPLLVRSLRRQLGRALAQTFYDFANEHTDHRPAHFHSLGRRAMVKAVWDVDRRLAEISNSFDLLLQVTPVNSEGAWNRFRAKRFERPPSFLYRPRTIDPGQMKRALFSVPIDRVEDPALMHLFLAKQESLDRQLTLIQDLGKPQFLYEGLQLYGPPPRRVIDQAREILDRVPRRSLPESDVLSAEAFADLAAEELQFYRGRDAEFTCSVEIREDLFAGLMVSRGKLLVGSAARVPRSRAEALIQHEVGTHLVTYHNGRAQPFKMLSSGLPGYEELQEGLAVLSEYLAGGFSGARLRVLAARVVAVDHMIRGASFAEVFQLLHQEFGFVQRMAFTITTRVFRGGGLPKDAVYLRGLCQVLDYISSGGDFEKLLVGKIAISQLPVIEELLLRKILVQPPLRPRYLDSVEAGGRIERLREGRLPIDLIQM